MESVQSFDFWDTLVARECLHPTDIFQYMAIENGLVPDFQQERIRAERRSNGTFDSIYEELQKHYGWSAEYTTYVKQLEIITEIKYIIPVQENIRRVRDGDIIVSDMYLPEKAFMDILQFIGFDKKNIKLFVTPGGKHNGSIWAPLLSRYNITLHLGDNPISDIESPKKHGIPTELTRLTDVSKIEKYFIEKDGLASLGHTLRRLRLDTPYESKCERDLWHDMMGHIIPAMVFFSIYIDTIAKEKGLTKIRFLTRDNKINQRIFQKLFPHYNTDSFISSRYLNKSNDARYKQYVRENYDDNTLLIDLNGSFCSGRNLFLELFGKLPNVLLFMYDGEGQGPTRDIFDTLYYFLKYGETRYWFSYETYVQSYSGRIIGLRNSGTVVRNENEYKYGHIVQKAIDMFVDSIPFAFSFSNSTTQLDLTWIKGFMNTTPLLALDAIQYGTKPDSIIPINKPVMPEQMYATKYYSQIGQDRYFIENINQGRKAGYFVEVGAHNGITFSNTYTLEKQLQWKGLCIEVDGGLFESLQRNRVATCVHACVFRESDIEKEIVVPLANPIPEGNDLLIRIKADTNTSFASQFSTNKTYRVVTKTLTQIFKENHVPNVIDYISIDIGGFELDALVGLDYSVYSFKFLTIEWGGSNTDHLRTIQAFLQTKGYTLHRINKWDAEFVPVIPDC